MLRIGVVEDEQESMDILLKYLNDFKVENNIPLSISTFKCPNEFLMSEEIFDLLFLDIEMPGMTGLDLARKIRKDNESVAIIFVTYMAQYAIKGYEVDALDYIVKPVTYFDFALKMNKILKKVKINTDKVISIKSNGETYLLPYNDIYYIEVSGHLLTYYTKKGALPVRSPLKKVEADFLANDFAKCNNYCLVNMKYITNVKGYDAFIQDKNYKAIVAISHPKKTIFVNTLNNFLGKN